MDKGKGWMYAYHGYTYHQGVVRASRRVALLIVMHHRVHASDQTLDTQSRTR